jgi:hypothetical protein
MRLAAARARPRAASTAVRIDSRISRTNIASQFVRLWLTFHQTAGIYRRPAREHAQRFLSAFSRISPHFRPRRHLLSATGWRLEMADRFTVWNQITGVTATAA